ncbi:MAG: fructosamine kinase family protein [Acidimicrobiales bacterium]
MRTLDDVVARALGEPVVARARAHGGDTSAAHRFELASGRIVFAKTHADPPPGFFTTEAAGLRWLGEPGAVAIPEVLSVADGDDEDPPHLVLGWVEEGAPRPGTEAELGRALAALHAASPATFGREDRRTTGSRALPNEPCPTWAEFYASQRLAPLARLARRPLLAPMPSSCSTGSMPTGWSSSAARRSRPPACTATSGRATASSTGPVGAG